ncbi:unnamed protein product [Phytophthora fragariaefolia]|uniref:Unnamed protein product n=1 Tax=Phytophthora fragariaefolia TaxID=1490495 RepID=A0A9W6XMA1_9STRA|nr:unnamed protein product [Phytophthora fragariaefolia]
MTEKLRAKPEIVADFHVSHKTDVHSWATIITCAGDSDTDVKFWNLSGELLQTVNTNQVANYHCVGSKDNRYIAVAAYTPEVKIYEIAREKSGAFKKVNKIMTLQGHRVKNSAKQDAVASWMLTRYFSFVNDRLASWTWRLMAPTSSQSTVL